MSPLSRLGRLDFFTKVVEDLREKGTMTGGLLSIACTVFMASLFVLELNSFLTVHHQTDVVIDQSADEMMQVNFDITLHRLPCGFANLDVEDMLGVHRDNLTSNIRKYALDQHGTRIREVQARIVAPKYEEMDAEEANAPKLNVEGATELNEEAFKTFASSYKVVLVNYYAPWCFWSRKLSPIWDKTAQELAKKAWGRQVAVGKVDCTKDESHKLCHSAHINAFPTVLVYRDGKTHTHEMYQGHRTVEAFVEFAQSLVGGEEDTARRLADQPEDDKLKAEDKQRIEAAAAKAGDVGSRAGPQGCNIRGFVSVKRVPGNIHIHAHNPGYSVASGALNVSHTISHLSFGAPLTGAEHRRLPPTANPLSDRFAGLSFWSDHKNTTFEHYMKVVANEYEFLSGAPVRTFKYTANSHFYDSVTQEPMVWFKYDLAPMAVVSRETKQPLYHFLTNICAIIGGVFTVMGLIDAMVDRGLASLGYKQQIGKAM